MTKTEMNMHRIHLEAVAAYLSGKQEEPDDAPSQHRMAVNRALHDLEKTNKELEKTRAYNAVLLAVAKEQQMIYGDQGKIVGELVRCKDCKHYRATPGYCAYDRIWQENKGHIWGMYCKPDWFCADGERQKG